jgi:bifunctional non-homologous end joining protein LigD
MGSPVRLTAGAITGAWVSPEMVVEVSFVGFTPDGLLRHVVYLGEREDKPAVEVVREEP